MRLQVLVVEDEEEWREIIREQFQSQDCSVTIAENFSVAEQLLRDQTFDIVTLDMWLGPREQDLGSVGVSGGWRLLERIAKHHPHTWVFVISQGFHDDPQRAYEQSRYGVKDFATKRQFDAHKITEWVEQVRTAKTSTVENNHFPM